jgi:AraC family transcriptional regulator
MNANPASWPIALEQRPKISTCARAVHQKGVSRYHLPKMWCLHLYDYRGELLVNGEALPIRPRQAGVLPPGVHLEYRLEGPSIHLFAHFSLLAAKESSLRVPVMEDLGGDFAAIYRDLEQAIGVFARWPVRTEVTVWNILWMLAQRHSQKTTQTQRRHPAVDRVAEIVERQLHEPLYGEELAREVNLSHHHLIRLFRSTLGTTLQSYIRQRRIQRARQLLLHSTLPIKTIAAEVGIPDIHLFNKTVRQVLGHSPRKVRERK